MQYTLTLVAGVKKSVGYRGRVFVLTDTGVASSIAVKMVVPGGGDRNDEEVSEATRGFGIKFGGGERFEKVELTSAVNATVKFIVSDNDVDYNVFDGATVNAVITANPLPVSNDRGTPGNLLHVTGVSLSDAPAVSIVNRPTVAAGPLIALIKPANAACRKARFVNLAGSPVAVGGVGLTWAARAIVLEPGDTWPEDIAGNLAWYAITDAGGAAIVGVQEIEQ